MSLKPLKVSEQKKKQEKINAKMQKREKEKLDVLPPYMYIISEGTKTEPNYIRGLADRINTKFAAFSSGKRIVIKGTGRNTRGLLNYARKQVEKEFPQAEVVWLMYDKDDFPLDNFDNTQYSAEGRADRRKYRVAWSNECIELWFVLHFQELTVNNGRTHYQEILKQKCDYEKNREDLYHLLEDRTAIAIRRARQLYVSYKDEIPPSRRCPATRVYELVEELQNYL